VDCDGDDDDPWKAVSFLVDGKWIEIEPEQYLIPSEYSSSECKLAFVES